MPELTPVRPALSIIVPAFNEAVRIRETIDTLRAHVPRMAPRFEVRVVDDGSEDDTADIVNRVAQADPRVVLQRAPHRGKGAAVRAGMLASEADLRFMCDADLSMPIAELSRFLAVVPSQCDLAIGSREGAGARRVGEPRYRHMLGRVFNRIASSTVVPGIHDTQCGFKLFTAAAVATVFPWARIDGWAFDVEVLHLARRRGLRVLEIPIEWHYRDLSRVSAVRDSVRMLREVVTIHRNSARGLYGSNEGEG